MSTEKLLMVSALLMGLVGVVSYKYDHRHEMLSLNSECVKTDNPRQDIWDCNITLKNISSSDLEYYAFKLDSSKTFSNFNFKDCDAHSKHLFTVSAKPGLSICSLRVWLDKGESTTFTLTVTGDSNPPDVSLIEQYFSSLVKNARNYSFQR
jgi:hypothetical protein